MISNSTRLFHIIDVAFDVGLVIIGVVVGIAVVYLSVAVVAYAVALVRRSRH